MKRLLLPLAICVLSLPALAAEKPRLKTLHKARRGQYDLKIVYPQWQGTSSVKRAANWQWRYRAYWNWYFINRQNKKQFADTPRDWKPAGGPNFYDMRPVLTLQKNELISGYYTTDYFDGGFHPNTEYFTCNIGLKNGQAKVLSVYDICLPGKTKALAAKVWKELRKKPGADWVNDGEMKADSPLLTQTWIAKPHGLRFIFAPYVVGSYAAGPQAVEIPYQDLLQELDPNGPLKSLLPRPIKFTVTY